MRISNARSHTHCQVAQTYPHPKPAKEYGYSYRTAERTNTNAENGRRKMHENLTNAKIHRHTEVLAKVGGIRYFPDIYRCPAYGF